jgi:YegS/Rv2252/BmrU family lipid kinase
MNGAQDSERGREVKRALVIGRQRPGHDVGSIVSEVASLLRRAGVDVEHLVVTRKKEVRRHARRAAHEGVDVVVAVGGDGTVLQVADSLAGTDVPLAIVPTGTGNLLASNLDVPHPPADAVATVLMGERRRIDVGQIRINGKRRVFTVACGIGFDADVMGRTSSEQKGRWGKLAYVASAVLESGNIRNAEHRLKLDGVASTRPASQVLIANMGRVGPGLEPPGVRADDGLLDVFVIRASGPLPALLAGWEALRHAEMGESDGGRVFRAQARKISVETRGRRNVEIDGSVIGTTPVKASIRASALTVLVPPPKD